MNCRDLARILPELVSGELDERVARMAEDHISGCASCAAERAEYDVALGALARANSMAEVPPALDVLRIPEERAVRRAWLQPAFATLAAAAILALVFLMPQPFRRTPVTPTNPPKIERTQSEQPKTNVKQPTPGQAQRAKVVVAVGPRHNPRPIAKPGVSRPAPAKEKWYADSPGRAVSEAESPESSAIVVAFDFGGDTPASSAMEIESTDPETGSVSVCNYSRDSEGRERVIEMTSNVRADSIGGTQP